MLQRQMAYFALHQVDGERCGLPADRGRSVGYARVDFEWLVVGI